MIMAHDDVLTNLSFRISFDPLPHPFPNIVQKEISKAYKLIKTKPKEAIKRFTQLRMIYSQEPSLLNNLICAYECDEQYDIAQSLQQTLDELFPDYLYGRIRKAKRLLQEQRHTEIPALFDNAFNLKDLYPQRDVFHESEVRFFSLIMLQYYCRINNLKQAYIHYEIIIKVSIEKDEILEEAQDELVLALTKDFSEKLKDENFTANTLKNIYERFLRT